MKKFRLPRKIKKRLEKQMWLYPADDKGNRLMAWPRNSQKDYTAVKHGVAASLMDSKNAKTKRKEYKKKLDAEIFITDEDLKLFVDDIFAKEHRYSSYTTLLMAKKTPKAIIAYYNFVNAYNLYKNGDESYSNICCLSVDRAKELLKRK